MLSGCIFYIYEKGKSTLQGKNISYKTQPYTRYIHPKSSFMKVVQYNNNHNFNTSLKLDGINYMHQAWNIRTEL